MRFSHLSAESGLDSIPFKRAERAERRVSRGIVWICSGIRSLLFARPSSGSPPRLSEGHLGGYVKLCAIRNVNVSREDSWPVTASKLGESDDAWSAPLVSFSSSGRKTSHPASSIRGTAASYPFNACPPSPPIETRTYAGNRGFSIQACGKPPPP